MAETKIGCLNCRGLSSDKIKKRDIFLYCRQNFDIIFLIDTHSTKKVESSWCAEWGYKINLVLSKATQEESLFCSEIRLI